MTSNDNRAADRQEALGKSYFVRTETGDRQWDDPRFGLVFDKHCSCDECTIIASEALASTDEAIPEISQE